MQDPEAPTAEVDVREVVRRLGYAEAPEPVEALGNLVRRGNSAALVAAEGSGAEVLYSVAVLASCDPEKPRVQALVLCTTRETALRKATALHRGCAEDGFSALAWVDPPRPETERGGSPPFAHVVAGRPVDLLPRIKAGRLGLSDLKLVVVDDLSSLEATGQDEATAEVLDTLPGDVQKIVADSRGGEKLQRLVEHRMARARRWPPELFKAGGRAPAASEGGPTVLAAAGASEEERLDALAAALRHVSEAEDTAHAFVHCRDEERAHRVAAALAARGFELTHRADEPGVVVAWGDDEEPPEGVAAVVGLPTGLPDLRRWLGEAAGRIVVVPTRELAQLRLLARRAGWTVRPAPSPVPEEGREAVEDLRTRIRDRLSSHEDAAELLVLEPLLEEHGAARVAAAVTALLRERGAGGARPGRPEAEEKTVERRAEPGARREPRPGGRSRPERGGREETGRRRGGRVESGWTRLFISAGRRDDVGPGDLVGAITGETSAVGGQIGRIQVRDSYSLVDVDPQIADQVMEKLTGAHIKGREVIARPDRES